MVGSRITKEILIVCQPEKVPISSRRGLVSRLCNILERRRKVQIVDSDSRVKRDSRYKLDRNEISDVEVNGDEVGDNEVGKKVQKTFKSKKLSKSKKTVESDFFTLGARLAFTKLRQAFVKTSILYHFDSKYYIRVETDVSDYAIGRVLSQLTLDNLD